MLSGNQLLDSDNSLLLIVDIQTRLTRIMPEKAAGEMLENSCRLVKTANLLDIPLFISEQYPKGLGSTLECLLAELNEFAVFFEKTRFSCSGALNFSQTLKSTGRKQIILVGQETHVCVLQTAIDLVQQGYQVHVVEDAVCSRQELHKLNALKRMQQSGIIISNAESVLFEWLKDSRHEHFSTISRLLR